jgi:hypothetical protein
MIQCPLKSASAVYKARGMYGIVEPFTRFDYYSICKSQGVYFRLTAQYTNESKKEEKLILFPNPTSDKLTVFLQSEIKEDYSIEIFNLLGQQIFEKKNCSNNFSIPLNTLKLSAGTYILCLKQLNTGKVFRERFQFSNQ